MCAYKLYYYYKVDKKWRYSRDTPTVYITGSPFDEDCADIVAENVTTIRGLRIYEALMACYYFHWIFKMKYTEEDEKVFDRFDKMLVELKKMPQSAINPEVLRSSIYI